MFVSSHGDGKSLETTREKLWLEMTTHSPLVCMLACCIEYELLHCSSFGKMCCEHIFDGSISYASVFQMLCLDEVCTQIKTKDYLLFRDA